MERSNLLSSIRLLVPLVFLISPTCSAEKVLLVPPPYVESHWGVLSSIAQAVVERGHVVTVVVSEDMLEKRRAERPAFRFETFSDGRIHARQMEREGWTFSTAGKVPLSQGMQNGRNMSADGMKYCELLLGNSYTFDGLVRKYLGAEETIQSVMSRTDVWLYLADHIVDFPRPTMPNMVPIGGMNVRAVVPLNEELEAFVQGSGKDGLIVVSFGSIMSKTMKPEKAAIFAAALARLRQKVLWRYEGEKPVGLGSNTKLVDWLPQNDLLGHTKTQAFVTHAGYKGVLEALHHGVPMVCLSLTGDTVGNAARVEARGLGVKLDFKTFTTDQLHQAILHVISNNSYRETAARLSRLHRDQPQSPMQRAVWWIEHVIRHGGLPHLRARAVDMPFYQYHLLDVAAFLLAVCSAVLGIVWCSCSLMCRKSCCKRGDKAKSE